MDAVLIPICDSEKARSTAATTSKDSGKRAKIEHTYGVDSYVGENNDF